MYVTRMREYGYTDKNGNYVKGTVEIAEEFKQQFITNVTDMGYEYSETSDSYMTFKKDENIASVLKVKAGFKHTGMSISDYICDIYFADSKDVENIKLVMKKLIPEINIDAEFSLAEALAEFNNSGTTVTRQGSGAHLDLKPVEHYGGVVVSIRKENN